MDIGLLKEKIWVIEDPRRPWGNLRHKLEDIIIIGLVSVDRRSEGVLRRGFR
jgi:hypothetical protein